MPDAEKDRPIIHKAGCGWETGPYCTCGADTQRDGALGHVAFSLTGCVLPPDVSGPLVAPPTINETSEDT